MRFRPLTLLGLYALVLSALLSVTATAATPDTQKRIQQHVEYLSSELLAGRLTGTKGEEYATRYIANVFSSLGLKPAGDNGRFFQEFTFTAGVSLGPSNQLKINHTNLELNREWRPLSFSDTVCFKSSDIVFAGYGITAPALNGLPAYDSYQGLDVTNKWVLVLRYTPEKISAARRQQLVPYSSPRYKVYLAKNHGAKGIIFVSGPNAKVQDQLMPLSFDASLTGAGIVAISVTDKIIDDLLKDNPTFNSLQSLQNELDLGQHRSFSLANKPVIAATIDIKHVKKIGRNVLAKLEVSADAKQTLVISAHADHLGHGELSGSRSEVPGLIHYGADDNASGVASVLEAAALLTQLNTRRTLAGNSNILFAIWSGEELGLLGSSHYVKQVIGHRDRNLRPTITANINLDMVGRLREHLVLQGIGSSSVWSKLIKQVNRNNPIPLLIQNDPYLPTDSTSFYLHGIPAVNFFTGAHDEYHTARDTAATLNYKGIAQITRFLVDLTVLIAKETTAPPYHRMAKKNLKHGRGFRVYLGTIPDYASNSVAGIALSGVTKNSPAERAGIQQHDVIIGFAGKKIQDIYDYTFVLQSLVVGESVPIIVRRGQKNITLHIIGRSRE